MRRWRIWPPITKCYEIWIGRLIWLSSCVNSIWSNLQKTFTSRHMSILKLYTRSERNMNRSKKRFLNWIILSSLRRCELNEKNEYKRSERKLNYLKSWKRRRKRRMKSERSKRKRSDMKKYSRRCNGFMMTGRMNSANISKRSDDGRRRMVTYSLWLLNIN